MEEVWKDIPDYEGYYQVSNLGRVRSLEHKVTQAGRSGSICHCVYKGRILKPEVGVSGRLRVALCKNNKVKRFFVHRLVLESFVGPCPEGKVGCHRDDNCLNNVPENLYWGTVQENIQDEIRNDKVRRGEDNGTSKITSDIAKLVKENCLTKQLKRKDFCEKYNITIWIYKHIQSNTTWKHITI